MSSFKRDYIKSNKTILSIALSLGLCLNVLSIIPGAYAQQGVPNNSPSINTQSNNYSGNYSVGSLAPTQSVQSFRQSMFNYYTSHNNLTSNLMNNSIATNQVSNLSNNAVPAISSIQQSNIAMQPHFSQAIASLPNSSYAESQVLSGGVQQQVVKVNTKRSGFSNNLSAVAGFVFGPMSYGTMMRPNYGNPAGLGFQALGYTGFGTRNGFRY